MDDVEFYKNYLPALKKALSNEDNCEQFNVKGPEFYLDLSDEKIIELENYLDQTIGKNQFLDNVAYYFDAKSHGFNEIDGELMPPTQISAVILFHIFYFLG